MAMQIDHCARGRLARLSQIFLASCSVALACAPALANVNGLPEIRLDAANQVPQCVTPERLMAFLKQRNRSLIPRFRNIASWYQQHGERWRVRWDYAFFQMAVETNFLTYRTGNGRMGDVDPRQNNFAGLGTTGGGVPGDSFADVSTGVLGQIQHLVAYSGERLDDPVAPRTALKQEKIISLSLKLERPVTFADLSRRWAVDPHYGRSIQWVARQFHQRYCRGQQANSGQGRQTKLVAAPARAVRPGNGAVKGASLARNSGPVRTLWRRDEPTISNGRGAASLKALRTPKLAAVGWPKPSQLGAQAPITCRIGAASYGGEKTVLLRQVDASGITLTALSVMAGFENSMTKSFQDLRAPGSQVLATFQTPDDAIARARALCAGTDGKPEMGPELLKAPDASAFKAGAPTTAALP